MKKFRITQIQFQGKATPAENVNLLEKFFIKSRQYKPDIICTPECTNIITDDKNHLFKSVDFEEDCPIIKMTKIFAKENNVNINLGSLKKKKRGSKKLLNRSFLIDKSGKILSKYDKIHLFDVNINSKENYRESNSFIKGKKLVLSKVNGVKIGLSICYDLRFPNMYRELAKQGAQIILIPAAFTVPTGKAHWETLVKARAIENSLFIVATNMCGTHHLNRKTYGHSLLLDPWGKIKNKCLSNSAILNTTIDLFEISKVRSKIPSVFKD